MALKPTNCINERQGSHLAQGRRRIGAERAKLPDQRSPCTTQCPRHRCRRCWRELTSVGLTVMHGPSMLLQYDLAVVALATLICIYLCILPHVCVSQVMVSWANNVMVPAMGEKDEAAEET